MESLFALAPHLREDRFLLLTVDAIFGPSVLPDFLRTAAEYPDADGVLAVNDFIDDEKPLRVDLDRTARITAIGRDADKSPTITAGFYVLAPSIFAEIESAEGASLSALRQFLSTSGAATGSAVPVPRRSTSTDRTTSQRQRRSFVAVSSHE
jgi:NDP-sugar pyrophosphorylase family protein